MTDAIAGFFGEQWTASPRDLDRMAKPIARMLARNPAIKALVQKYASPLVLIGATCAYAAHSRTGKAPRAPQQIPSVQEARPLGAQPAPPVAPTQQAATAAVPPPDFPQSTEDIEHAARQAENMVRDLQSKTFAVG